MTTAAAGLANEFRDLDDANQDFQRSATIESAPGLLQRFVDALQAASMSGFLKRAIPSAQFESWWREKNGGLHILGGGSIDWPSDRLQRVALQVDFCVYLAGDDHERLADYTYGYYGHGSRKISDHLRGFADELLAPLVRDIKRLAEQRPLSAPLAESVRNRPTSSDAILDGLLADACAAFTDSAPAKQRQGLEKLWDAFERAKTLHPGRDKKASADALAAAATDDAAMQAVLGAEMKALSDIGNSFHIRHFETNRSPVTDAAQVDYFFHRLLALLQVLLRAGHP